MYKFDQEIYKLTMNSFDHLPIACENRGFKKIEL